MLINRKRRAAKAARKSSLRTTIKKFEISLEQDPANAPAHLRKAVKALDQAAAKGIIHKNAAARTKSRLTRKLAAQV